MTLKKFLKHADTMAYIQLQDASIDDAEACVLYDGDIFDIPKKYKKWHLYSCVNYEAISFSVEKTAEGGSIHKFYIVISKPKKEKK